MAEESATERALPDAGNDDPGRNGLALDLTTWTLATMNTVVLVVGLVVGVHASGALADLLGELNTLMGVAVFLFLWGLFVLSVRWVLADASLADSPLRSLALRGIAAGGTAGICFLVVVLAVALLPLLLAGSIAPRVVLLVGAIGTGIAAVVGALLGLIAALVDTAIYRLAGTIL